MKLVCFRCTFYAIQPGNVSELLYSFRCLHGAIAAVCGNYALHYVHIPTIRLWTHHHYQMYSKN